MKTEMSRQSPAQMLNRPRHSGSPAARNHPSSDIQNSQFVQGQRSALQAMFGGAASFPSVALNAMPDSTVQRKAKEETLTVGTDIKDHAGVQSKIGADTDETVYRYVWAGKNSAGASFDGSYNGSVSRALNWGITAHEGVRGWTERTYPSADFDALATAAGQASNLLNASAALNNDSNKTLVAVRAFRGSVASGMAAQTASDLGDIESELNRQKAALAAAGLIGNQAETISSIKADPAEAHPNTLPTAKVKFSGGQSLYFKGRSSKVEDALVGTGGSAAMALSQLGGRPGSAVGTHGFVDFGTAHAAANVGPKNNPTPTWDAAVDGWLSAAKTAALAFLSGTGDLHASNVIAGISGKKHIIDAEFLLDSTAWERYEQFVSKAQAPDFEVADMAPDWLKQYTQSMYGINRRALASEVIEKFEAVGLDQKSAQEKVLQPLRNIFYTDALLRVSPKPFLTDFWLGAVTFYQIKKVDDPARAASYVDDICDGLFDEYANLHVDLKPGKKAGIVTELKANFDAGMVPLFHLSPKNRKFYMNKTSDIGTLREDRGPIELLRLTKRAFQAEYNTLLAEVRRAIVGATFSGKLSFLSGAADVVESYATTPASKLKQSTGSLLGSFKLW